MNGLMILFDDFKLLELLKIYPKPLETRNYLNLLYVYSSIINQFTGKKPMIKNIKIPQVAWVN